MPKDKTKGVDALKNLLLSVLDLQEDLGLAMFRQDQPEASIEDFRASPDKPRYMAYAKTAITHLMPAGR